MKKLLAATSTPLASIFGSGFLIIVPILNGAVGKYLPLPLIGAAVLSQFSAAVADTMGGAGNMVEATHNHVDAKHANLIICVGALILALFPTLTILALASRAFAFYYMLQCLISVTVTKNAAHRGFFIVIAAILLFITLFAVPAG